MVLGTLAKDHFAEELNTILAKLGNQQKQLAFSAGVPLFWC